MKSFTAGPNENGVRLSRFVEGVTKDMPRSMMYKAFRNKRIKVNGKRAEPDTRLQTGDLIEMYINDEFFPVGKPATKTAKPQRKQPPVTVVYEDANFAVLYKPAHLLCHSDRTEDDGTMTKDEFFVRLAEDSKLPRTSQPSPASFMQVYEDAAAAGDEVLVITIGQKLSGTYQCAHLAAADVGLQVHIVDSEAASQAEALLVREHLAALCKMSGKALADQRYKKYRRIGEMRGA